MADIMRPAEQPKVAAATATNLSDLSNELLRRIGNYLDTRTKLKLRLVLREKAMASLFNNDFGPLYVAPTKGSLKFFRKLCTAPFFQEHVKEVVFVATACVNDDWQGEIETLKAYRRRARHENRHGDLEGVDAGSLQNDALMKNSFHIYKTLSRDLAPQVEIEDSDSSPEVDCFSILQAGIWRLQNAHSFTIVSNIDHAGLNETTFLYSNDYALGRIGSRPHCKSDDQAGRIAGFLRQTDHAGASAFIEALSQAALSPRLLQLHLGNGMKQLPFALHNSDEMPDEALGMLAARLYKLSISCADDEHENGGDEIWQMLAQNACNLQELKLHLGLAFIPTRWRSKNDESSVTDLFLHSASLSSLTKLEIKGQYDKPGVIRAQDFWRFVTTHKSTLRQVVLNSAMPVGKSGPGDIPSTIRILVRKIRELATINFQLRIYRRDEHYTASCRRGDGSCDLECENYIMESKWIQRSVFEALATDLKVPLIDQWWDFGQAVNESS